MKKLLVSFSIILALAITTQASAQTYGPEWNPGPNYDNFQPGPDYDNFQPDAPRSWFDRFIDNLLGGAI